MIVRRLAPVCEHQRRDLTQQSMEICRAKAKIAIIAEPATHDYKAECLQGRELAATLIEEMSSGATYLLGWKVNAMASKPWSGVQVGFAAYIAERAMDVAPQPDRPYCRWQARWRPFSTRGGPPPT